jgi:gliding motility-associated-like protein
MADGTYTVSIMDVNGCTTTTTTDVSVHTTPTATIGSNSPVCEGEDINLTESGGEALGWSWSGPNGFVSTQQNPTIATASASADGVYTLTITDVNGCSVTANEAVTVNPLPSSPVLDTDCTGGVDAGTLSVTSPVGSDYEYSIDGSWQASTDFGPLANGTYEVSVMNVVTGCESSPTSVTLDCGCSNPTTLALASSTGEICETAPFTLTGNTFGGSATQVILTHDGNGSLNQTTFNASPFDFTYTPDVLDEGTTVNITLVTDNPEGAPCTVSQEIYSLTINPSPAISLTSNTPVCEGGDINLSETGGAAINWSWDGPDTFTSTLQNPTISTAAPTNAGVYTVTITDGNGCTTTASTDVTVHGTPTASTGSNSPVCDGSDINVSETGGEAVSWSWDGPGTFTSTEQDPTLTSATPAASGTYTVTITDGNGCTTTSSTDVTVHGTPTATAGSNSPVCEGSDINLTETGGAAVSWTWSGPDAFSSTEQDPTLTSATPAASGTYTVTLTDGNGCTTTASTDVTVNPTPTVTVSSNAPICEGGDITLSENGGDAVSWNWSGPDGFTSSAQDTLITAATSSANGTYTLEISDVNGCTASADVNVTVYDQPTLDISCNSPICEGESLNLTENGGDAVSWSWSGPEGFTSDSDSPVISPATTLHNGNYNCSITDANGCSASGSISVVVHSMPNVNIMDTNALCSTSSPFTLDAYPAGGIWSGNGITDNSAGVFDPSEANIGINTITYEVTENGCTASDQIEMEIVESLDASITDPGYFCSDDAAIQLQTADDGGNWSGDAVNDSGYVDPSDLGPGEYQVIYSIDHYCGSTDTLLITVYERADATITYAPDSLFINDPSVLLEATNQGGSWSGDGIDEVSGEFVPYDAGLGAHQIIYTISEFCGDSDTTMIVVSEEVIADLKIPDVFTPNDDGYNDTWEIQGIEAIPNVEIFIVTRWGDQVFEFKGSGEGYADATAQWDGTHQGKDLPFGTYVYVVKLSDSDIHKGTVTIVR